jgi:peptide/nickel transport system substrate-binding protein
MNSPAQSSPLMPLPLVACAGLAITRSLRFWLLALMACGLAIALTNCRGVTEQGSGATASNTLPPATVLVYGAGGEPVSLNPGNITDTDSLMVQAQIYNRLLDFVPGTADIEPSLATEWRVSEDGLTWTFTLREAVQFQDGTPFNAEAAVFNVNRWWDPDFEFGDRPAGNLYAIWRELFGGFKGTEESLLEAVTALDDTTVSFSLRQPFAAFPAAIASGYFGIASPTAIRKAGATYGRPDGIAVGTGPFVLREWQAGDRIALDRNPNYWKTGLPKSEQVLIRFVADPADRLAQLDAGTLDFTVDLMPEQLPALERNPNLEAVYRPSFNVGYLALNPTYEPLASVQVRQAIAQAINKQALVETFWGDLGTTDSHFIPPAMADFRARDLEDYVYDPEAAKQHLAEAGYPNGFPLDLWYMPVSRPYFPAPKPIADALAADLSAVGVPVTLKTKEWGLYLEDRKQPPGFQAFMLGWTGDYGDPDNFLYAHFGPGATADLGLWQNQQIFDLLDQARAEKNLDARKELYAEVDRLIFAEAVRLPIVHSQPLLARRSRVEGWLPGPLGAESFETIEKR